MNDGDLEEKIIQDAWTQHNRWDDVATKLKDRVSRGRTILLFLLIAGSAFGTAAAQWEDQKELLAFISAVLVGLVPIISLNRLQPNHIENWTKARAASESYKSLVFMFLGRGGSFRGAEVDRVRRFNTAINEVDATVSSSATITNLINEEAEIVAPPSVAGKDDYVNERIVEQIDRYYMPAARRDGRKARRLRGWAGVLTVAASVLGICIAASEDIAAVPHIGAFVTPLSEITSAWITVMTAAAGAIISYMASSRFEEQAATYHMTARKLTQMQREAAFHDFDTVSWASFVRECEDVIANQNKQWVAAHIERAAAAPQQ